MQIKLSWISVENFKKLTYRLDAGGDPVLLAGRNGTGKTTLADAFFWLLTDSDSDQQTKFNLLELDENGEPVNKQDAVVEAELFVGSKALRLKKIYKQKWTTKRGSAKAELTSHTTDHYFDQVPVSKTKFGKKLADIIDPDIIRSICDVHFFCGRLKPEKRREILMEIAGQVSDAEICEKNNAKDLLDLLGDKTPEELKKILSLEMREVKKSLDRLPERIDELRKMMPDVEGREEGKVIASIATLQEQIDAEKNEILAIKAGVSVSEKQKKLTEMQIEATKVAAALQDEYGGKQHKLLEKIDGIKRDRERLQAELRACGDAIAYAEKQVEDYTIEKARLIEKWQDISGQEFEPAETCFACGQILGNEAVANQQAEFNLKKSEKLKPIDERGRWLSGEIQRMNEEIAVKKLDAKRIDKDMAGKLDVIADFENQIKALDSEKALAIENRTASINVSISQLQDEIREQQADIAPAIESAENRLSELEKEKGGLEEIKLEFVQAEKCTRRIEERQQQLKETGKAYEEIERKLNLLDEFSTWKSSYIEQNVNGKFTLTRWKLFEQQVNGGVREICEATKDGVPYSSDLNTGSRINVGLDVIQALQKHYQITMPVWIDNAESVTDWQVELDGQMIKLAAAPNIENLEIIDNGEISD